MSIQGIQQPAYPYPNPVQVNPVMGFPAPVVTGTPVPPSAYPTDELQFDRYRQHQCKPVLTESPQDKSLALLLHPMQYKRFARMQTAEGPVQTLKMVNAILRHLDPGTQKQFKDLINQGILTSGKSDDGHSALYHLYGILTTPRAQGYNNQTILKETVEVLSQPYSISQRFAPVTPQGARQLMQVRNSPGLNPSKVPPPVKPVNWQDLNVESSATCVASSVMYYMADKEPTGLARHINELTSPMNAFFEKAKLEEISPDNPQQAFQILQERQIPYYISGSGEVTIKVENPPAGVIRAIEAQKVPTGAQYRNAIGAAYQSAITFLATRSYDPATDLRDADAPGETSKGLTEVEKTLMEAIIKDNGGVQSVTYQAVNNKANPAPGEESNSYLFGYNRRFEQTRNDILQALQMNEPVIIGTTDTDETGAIVAGHEITITSAYIDRQDNQLKFVVADSDDNLAAPVVKSARELIPTIHHAGLPVRLARKINQEIQASQGNYLIPDQQDQANFKLLSRETGPMPADASSPTNQQPSLSTAQPTPVQPLPGQLSGTSTPAQLSPNVSFSQPQLPFTPTANVNPFATNQAPFTAPVPPLIPALAS